MRQRWITLCTVVSAAICLTGCAKEENSSTETFFQLGQTSVNVPAEGGEITVGYVLENPVEGLEVIPKVTVDWVHDFDMSDAGKVSFTVDSTDMEVEERTCVLILEYGDEVSELTIVQAGAEARIILEVEQARHYSIVMYVEPRNPEMRVFFNVIKQEVMDSYSSDEELFAADNEYFNIMAEESDITIEQFKSAWYRSDGYRPFPYSYVNLSSEYHRYTDWIEPDTDYCVYCYGVDENLEPLTQVYRVSVTTKALELSETPDFEIGYSIKDQTVVTVSVTPSDPSARYYFGALLADPEMTDSEFRKSIQGNIDASVFMTYSYPESVLNGGAEWASLVAQVSSTGPAERTLDMRAARREGRAYAYAIDDMGNIISEGKVVRFYTEDVPDSDNSISLSVSDVGFFKANLSVTVTNDDPYKVAYAIDDGGFDGLSPDEKVRRMEEIGETVYVGSGNSSHELTPLERERDYIVLAYGYSKFQATTEPVELRFRTIEQTVAEVKCEPYFDNYFNSLEVYEKYPEEFALYEGIECAIIPVQAGVTGEPAWYVYHMMTASVVNSMTDEQLLSVLDNLYRNQGTTGPSKIFGMNMDVPMALFGVAVDKDGNYSEVYKQEFTFTREGCSPIDEFVLE